MFNFDLGLISKYRSNIMGIATIMILCCHAVGRNVTMPSEMLKILNFGNYGVDIFLFVSGMGQYYSLLKKTEIDGSGGQGVVGGGGWYKSWYINKLQRILVPYFIVFVPYYSFICMIHHYGILFFLVNVSTLGFWLYHEGAWFVALLIPLYLITPFIYSLFQRLHRINSKFISWFLFILLCSAISLCGYFDSSSDLFNNFIFAFRRVPSFLLGLWLGPTIKIGAKIRFIILLLMLLLAVFITKVSHNHIAIMWLLVLPIITLFIMFFSYRNFIISRLFNKITLFFGKISLESYLTNITVPIFISWAIILLDIEHFNKGNYLMYGISLIVGICLSCGVNSLAALINTKLQEAYRR